MACRHIIDRITDLYSRIIVSRSPSSLTQTAIPRTMIRLSPLSSNCQALAICKIPAGSGFGGRKSLVTMGAKVFRGRNVCRRCVTGPLYRSAFFFTFHIALILVPVIESFPPSSSDNMPPLIDLLKVPRTQSHPYSLFFQVLYQLH